MFYGAEESYQDLLSSKSQRELKMSVTFQAYYTKAFEQNMWHTDVCGMSDSEKFD